MFMTSVHAVGYAVRAVVPQYGIIYIVNYRYCSENILIFEKFCQRGIDIVCDEHMWVEWRSAFMVLA